MEGWRPLLLVDAMGRSWMGWRDVGGMEVKGWSLVIGWKDVQ